MERPRFLQAEEGIFRTPEKFYEYLQKGKLNPSQAIRVHNYSVLAGEERLFALGLEGKLYDQDQKEVNPKEVLNSPDGWEFDYFNLDCLPEEVILNLP